MDHLALPAGNHFARLPQIFVRNVGQIAKFERVAQNLAIKIAV
jgi:hypothetical protein